MARDLNELVDQYVSENNLHTEGRRGVIALCQIARALGYKDQQYFGQLSQNACIGDLINMLEDNSGMIEAMIEWVGTQRNTEWTEALEDQVEAEEEPEEEPEV